METVLGLILWAVVAFVIVRWRSQHRSGASPPTARDRPLRRTLPAPAPTSREQERRQDEAFFDGLAIGSYFYGDQFRHPDEQVDSLTPDGTDLHLSDDELHDGDFDDDFEEW